MTPADRERAEPLSQEAVEAMGLTLGPLCDQTHGAKMQPHRHIALPDENAVPMLTHSCPICGDVHLPPSGSEVPV